jgi:sugar phosphate isomerase/epimerase
MLTSPTVGYTVQYYAGLAPSTIIPALKMLGIRYFEVNRTIFQETEAVQKVLNHTTLSLHLPLIHEDGWDFSCSNRQQEIDDLIEKINQNRECLNLAFVITHPPEPGLLSNPELSSLETLSRNLSKIQLPVLVENVSAHSPSEFDAVYRRLQKGDETIRRCFDAAHYWIRGENPVDRVHQDMPAIQLFHLSDCTKTEDRHQPFGRDGDLPIDEVLQAIKAHRYSGYITLEIKPQSLQDIKSYIESYLKVTRILNRTHYFSARLRLLICRLLFRWFTR